MNNTKIVIKIDSVIEKLQSARTLVTVLQDKESAKHKIHIAKEILYNLEDDLEV